MDLLLFVRRETNVCIQHIYYMINSHVNVIQIQEQWQYLND